jgi:FPC/CPF motif-containing protein YcgG
MKNLNQINSEFEVLNLKVKDIQETFECLEFGASALIDQIQFLKDKKLISAAEALEEYLKRVIAIREKWQSCVLVFELTSEEEIKEHLFKNWLTNKFENVTRKIEKDSTTELPKDENQEGIQNDGR